MVILGRQAVRRNFIFDRREKAVWKAHLIVVWWIKLSTILESHACLAPYDDQQLSRYGGIMLAQNI